MTPSRTTTLILSAGKGFSNPFSGKEWTAERGRTPSGLGAPYGRRFCSGGREGTPQTPRFGLWLSTSGKGCRPRPLGVRARRREDRLDRALSAVLAAPHHLLPFLSSSLDAIWPTGPQPADPAYLRAPPLREAAVSQADTRNANRRGREPFGLARTP